LAGSSTILQKFESVGCQTSYGFRDVPCCSTCQLGMVETIISLQEMYNLLTKWERSCHINRDKQTKKYKTT
jgi:hypothetical protein